MLKSIIPFILIFALYLFMTFDLAGGESLQQIENQRTFLLASTVILFLIFCIISIQYFKKNNTRNAYGLIILPFVILILVVGYYFKNYNFHTELDQNIWKKEEWKPLNMAATLVNEDELKGLSYEEVIELLGTGFDQYYNEENNNGYIKYHIEKSWTLTIFFEKGVAVRSELRLPRMMT